MLRVQKSSSAAKANRGSHSQSYKVPRSCVGCHRRKVRCDRGVPCTNCSRLGFTCVYPTKDTDEPKHPNLQHISDRLKRVETLLSDFCESRVSGAPSGLSENQIQPGTTQSSSAQRSSRSWELLLDDGRNFQYVNNPNIKDLLQDEERMRMTPASCPEAGRPQLQQGENIQPPPMQPLPRSDYASDVLELYPGPQLALRLWAVYVKSVDPVLKILHIPTTQSAIIATILDPQAAKASIMALTFAIYFAAVTALKHNNEPVDLPLEKSALLKRYKDALDRLLLVTDLMNHPEMTAIQALAIYTTCLRVHETGRSVWVLNGLAIRLARSIGLHRDGAYLRLNPFDTEIRLRLWWHLCVLDTRAPEDQGFELTVDTLSPGLRLPLNINDNQIFPDMRQLPIETEGWTDMSFFLIQTLSCRLLEPVLGSREQFSVNVLSEISEKRKMIEEHKQHAIKKHGISGETSDDLPRIAIQHLTTACKKMEFILQLREEIDIQKQKGHQGNVSDRQKPSFKLACDTLESNYRLLKGDLSSGFKWLFTTYTQWYALAYVLRCLCSSPCGPGAERAWALIEECFPHEITTENLIGINASYGQDSVWKCLSLLRQQALLLRDAQLATEDRIQPRSERRPSQGFRLDEHLQNPEVLSDHSAEIGMSLSDPGILHEHELISDSSQNIFSSLDFPISDFPFLPEWNTIINGCLNEDGNLDAL